MSRIPATMAKTIPTMTPASGLEDVALSDSAAVIVLRAEERVGVPDNDADGEPSPPPIQFSARMLVSDGQ